MTPNPTKTDVIIVS